MELQLKYLAPYLPCSLVLIIDKKHFPLIVSNDTITFDAGLEIKDAISFKANPLLRPLSQIQSYFEPLWDSDIDVRTYLSEEYITSFGFESIEEILEHKVEWWPVGFYTTLLKHHFDVFDLIKNGLATIKE